MTMAPTAIQMYTHSFVSSVRTPFDGKATQSIVPIHQYTQNTHFILKQTNKQKNRRTWPTSMPPTPLHLQVRSFERLLRKLLEGDLLGAVKGGVQRAPAAVLIVNMWRCCVVDGDHYVLTRFTEHLTDHHNIVAQYYGVPSVAVRNGV